jgi:hypothetical protein
MRTKFRRNPWIAAVALGALATLNGCGSSGPAATPSAPASATASVAVTLTADNAPSSRVDFSLAFDQADGQLVLFGGRVPVTTTRLADTWTWNGHTWTQVNSATSPTPRESAPATYDPITRSVLLVGGMPTGALQGTWSFDGTWHQLNPAHEPATGSSSLRGQMAYDPATNTVVLEDVSAGSEPGSEVGNTYSWSGSDWTVPSPSACPSESSCRFEAGLAFDPSGGRLILAGGAAQSGFDDTDAWDGHQWTHVATKTAPPSGTFLAALDTARGAIVATSCMGDTWRFSGGDWQQLHPAHTPPVMSRFGSCSLAYDSVHKVSILMGVADAPAPGKLVMWAWDGSDWQELAG